MTLASIRGRLGRASPSPLNPDLPTGHTSKMADKETTAETQGAETQAAENKTTEAQTTETQAAKTEEGQTAKTFTQEEVNRMLAKEKRDAEKRATDAEAKSKLADDERTKLELKEAKDQLAERDRRDSAIDGATKAGVKNAKLFYNAYKNDLETDDKGVITNLKEILEAAKAESPELFVTPVQGSADGGAGKAASDTAVTRAQFDAMTSAQRLKFATDGGTIKD